MQLNSTGNMFLYSGFLYASTNSVIKLETNVRWTVSLMLSNSGSPFWYVIFCYSICICLNFVDRDYVWVSCHSTLKVDFSFPISLPTKFEYFFLWMLMTSAPKMRNTIYIRDVAFRASKKRARAFSDHTSNERMNCLQNEKYLNPIWMCLWR